MKQLLLASVLMLLSIGVFAQAPVSEIRMANATTAFTTNLPVGTKIYQVDTDQHWVVITAIDATGGTKSITTELLKLSEIAPINFGTPTNTTLLIKTSPSVVGEADTRPAQKITLTEATASSTPTSGTGTAGLISGDDKRKLDLISDVVGSIGTYISETFPVTSGAPSFSPTLAHTASTSTSIVVSLNGAVLQNSQYSLNGVKTIVTVSLPVLTDDVVTVSYTY